MMTQDEINKMMQASQASDSAEADIDATEAAFEPLDDPAYQLDSMEKDAIGEVSNICMGTCATTLYTLLNKRVNITTPTVTIGRIANHIEEFETPFVAVGVEYIQGISGFNIFILKQDDVLMMTDLLMGGDGTIKEGAELDELAFSAISEVMNQMVGSSSTSLANVLGRTINISTPNVKKVALENPDLSEFISNDDVTIKISFRMEIEDLLVSNIMQIIPFESGKEILHKILGEDDSDEEPEYEAPIFTENTPQPAPAAPAPQPVVEPPIAAAPPITPQPAPAPAPSMQKEQNMIGVKAVQYQSFDSMPAGTARGGTQENMGLIMEVPLNVTVELGNCKKSIKEILSFSTGSVIVLNRMAGEMVDIMVNGVLYAVGEVVVIDDNYGVRITEIVNQPT